MSELIKRNLALSLLTSLAVGIIISLQVSKVYARNLGEEKLSEGKEYVNEKIDSVMYFQKIVNDKAEYQMVKDSILSVRICDKLDSLSCNILLIKNKIK
jgi:hypothetical protein